MKPFLILTTRDHDEATRGEVEAVRRHARLGSNDLVHLRVEASPLPELNLADYSGLLLGGSPFNISDSRKTPLQLRVEADLRALVDRVVEEDFPFLGMCYGIGTVTVHLGGVVDKTYGETAGATQISLTSAAAGDPVLDGVPETFEAFVGHKEACNGVPPGVLMLATGTACPVQMYRHGANVYVTQFHPELDADDLENRMRIYSHAGYFHPDELEDLVAMARNSGVNGSQHRILANFVRRYARD
ncbi:MAG: glutamine amidotransferase [Micropruina sp.]|nr:glutamine amidotransferase [Micropruina sp.]